MKRIKQKCCFDLLDVVCSVLFVRSVSCYFFHICVIAVTRNCCRFFSCSFCNENSSKRELMTNCDKIQTGYFNDIFSIKGQKRMHTYMSVHTPGPGQTAQPKRTNAMNQSMRKNIMMCSSYLRYLIHELFFLLSSSCRTLFIRFTHFSLAKKKVLFFCKCRDFF